jgi:tetratricopeptide (TPR) repeat protein
MLASLAIVSIGLNVLTAAMALRNQAVAELEQGRTAQAEALASRSLSIAENEATLNALGEVFFAEKRYSDAEKMFRRAIRMGAKAGGGPHYATALNNLGAVYHVRGQTDRAYEYYEKALRIRRKLFGDQSTITLATARNISTLDREAPSLRADRSYSLRSRQ